MSRWIKWGGYTAFESKEFTKGKPKIIKGCIPTLRANKVCACVIEVLDEPHSETIQKVL